jgi:hypothetical protein
VAAEAAEAGFGVPVGASGAGGAVPAPLATTAAEGKDGSDAGEVGTAGRAALAGMTTAVAGAESGVCLLQAINRATAVTDVHVARLFSIRSLLCAGRTASGTCASRD